MWRKKKSLSFLPPWEFQTPLSLGTPRLPINLPRKWLSHLAKRRLCLGPAGVINCTPLSALSFWVSLFPGTRGYNIYIATLLLYPIKMLCPSPSGRQIWDLWDPSLCLAATWINIFSAEKSWRLSIGLTVYRGKWSWFRYIRNTTDHFPYVKLQRPLYLIIFFMLNYRDHYIWPKCCTSQHFSFPYWLLGIPWILSIDRGQRERLYHPSFTAFSPLIFPVTKPPKSILCPSLYFELLFYVCISLTALSSSSASLEKAIPWTKNK